MTLEEEQARKGRTYKMLLWFGMISICMIFAGLTSGFIVSKKRPDWVADFNMPNSLIISTILILISSVTFHLAKKSIKEGVNSRGMIFLTLNITIAKKIDIPIFFNTKELYCDLLCIQNNIFL